MQQLMRFRLLKFFKEIFYSKEGKPIHNISKEKFFFFAIIGAHFRAPFFWQEGNVRTPSPSGRRCPLGRMREGLMFYCLMFILFYLSPHPPCRAPSPGGRRSSCASLVQIAEILQREICSTVVNRCRH